MRGHPCETFDLTAGWLGRDHGFGISCGEGVHVGEDEVAGAVGAELGLVLAADDGEGAEDIVGVIAGKAVEVEVEGVEAGPQVASPLSSFQTKGGPSQPRSRARGTISLAV